jgi:hypothetical protein
MESIKRLIWIALILEAASPGLFIFSKLSWANLSLFGFAGNLIYSIVLAGPYGILILLCIYMRRKYWRFAILIFSTLLAAWTLWWYDRAFQMTRPDQGPELVYFGMLIIQIPIVSIFAVILIAANWLLKRRSFDKENKR